MYSICMSRTYSEFFSCVRRDVRLSDLLLIATVPMVLTVVLFLPVGIKEGLVLDHANPSFYALWTSAYVHLDYSHYFQNSLAYVILIGPIYLLFALGNERRAFISTFLAFLFVLPVAISLVNLLIMQQGAGYGFSGIGSAFFGLLPWLFSCICTINFQRISIRRAA